MNQEAYKQIILEIEKVGLDHIDEEKLTGILLDFTDKNCAMFDHKATDSEIDAMVNRGLNKGGEGGAIAPTYFGGIEGATGQRRRARRITTCAHTFKKLLRPLVKHFTIKDDFQVPKVCIQMNVPL